jgi:hypothetical protein
MTSLAFMLVEVPAPPWIMSTTNCSCQRPAMISSQAALIACSSGSGRWPSRQLARAAAFLTIASARIRFGKCDSAISVMRKLSSARAVCTP